MAGEAKVTVAIDFTKNPIPQIVLASGQQAMDVAGSNYMRNVQTVGTSIEALLLGDVATPGLCVLHNLDPTNYIEVFAQVGDTVPLLKLRPGGWQLVEFGTPTPYVKAHTGACALEYFLLPA